MYSYLIIFEPKVEHISWWLIYLICMCVHASKVCFLVFQPLAFFVCLFSLFSYTTASRDVKNETPNYESPCVYLYLYVNSILLPLIRLALSHCCLPFDAFLASRFFNPRLTYSVASFNQTIEVKSIRNWTSTAGNKKERNEAASDLSTKMEIKDIK